MKISIVQFDIQWQNVEKNLEILEEKIAQNEDTDLIILPEMFTTGFTMNPELCYEEQGGRTEKWLEDMSCKYNTAIVGSIIIKEDAKYYNRLFWKEKGRSFCYNKINLFSMAGEDKFYEPGNQKCIIDYKGFKFSLFICYDLRFPVWNRNTEIVDCIIYIANWPQKRIDHWSSLLKARSIENQAYTIGVNRIGLDGNKHYYSGESQIYNARGEKKVELIETDTIYNFTLDKSEVEHIRKELPFLKDIEKFQINQR
jgi:omega-amidase